jgi:hypothetical protein
MKLIAKSLENETISSLSKFLDQFLKTLQE